MRYYSLMNNIQEILIGNMIKLRKAKKLTQCELGEKINYSDKTISKWENGDTCPNIEAVYRISQFYNVSIDEMLKEDFIPDDATPEEAANQKVLHRQKRYSKIVIAMLSVVSVWTIATISFIYGVLRSAPASWIAFIDALPASCIVLLAFNTLWGKSKYNYIVISVLLWTLITSIYLHLLSYNLWMIYLLGIPIEIAVILWSQLKK